MSKPKDIMEVWAKLVRIEAKLEKLSDMLETVKKLKKEAEKE